MKSILQNKSAVITGGARGVGRSIAEMFLQEGSKVVICSRNLEELKETAKNLDPEEKNLFYTTCDVSSFDDCRKLFEFAKKKLGKIDILVNNAGIYGPIGPLEKNPQNEWFKAIAINLMGTVFCTKLALEQMKQQKSGKIINLAGAGVGGQKPLSRFSSYYTSKAAVAAFTEVVASEVKNFNIQVNCISPGAINTHFTDYLLSQDPNLVGPVYEQAKKQKESGGDSPQLGAKLAVFLASEESNNITGKILSAKWDKIEKLKKISSDTNNLYTLRRIDEELFGEREKS